MAPPSNRSVSPVRLTVISFLLLQVQPLIPYVHPFPLLLSSLNGFSHKIKFQLHPEVLDRRLPLRPQSTPSPTLILFSLHKPSPKSITAPESTGAHFPRFCLKGHPTKRPAFFSSVDSSQPTEAPGIPPPPRSCPDFSRLLLLLQSAEQPLASANLALSVYCSRMELLASGDHSTLQLLLEIRAETGGLSIPSRQPGPLPPTRATCPDVLPSFQKCSV